MQKSLGKNVSMTHRDESEERPVFTQTSPSHVLGVSFTGMTPEEKPENEWRGEWRWEEVLEISKNKSVSPSARVNIKWALWVSELQLSNTPALLDLREMALGVRKVSKRNIICISRL